MTFHTTHNIVFNRNLAQPVEKIYTPFQLRNGRPLGYEIPNCPITEDEFALFITGLIRKGESPRYLAAELLVDRGHQVKPENVEAMLNLLILQATQSCLWWCRQANGGV